jgi:hypothetical protein
VQSVSHLEQLLRQAHTAIESSAESMRLSALSQISAGSKAAAQPGKEGPAARGARFDTSDLRDTKEDRAKGRARAEARSDGADEDEDEDEDEDLGADAGTDADAEPDDLEEGVHAAGSPHVGDDGVDPRDEDEDEDEDEDAGAALPELPREEAPPRRKSAAASQRAAVRVSDGKGRSITIEGSPALLELVRRIQAFERLTQRGELLKAAVVAESVLGTLNAFDPRVFFPKLLLPFFSQLSEHAQEIEGAMAERDSLAFQSLKQLLQVDIDALVK